MTKYLFIVAQKAVIKKGKKYLIVKRSSKARTYPNHWDFPGGKLESGENVFQGLKREVLEETGLKINVIKIIHSFHEILYKIPTIFLVYQCKKVSGKVKLSKEHTEYKWATKSEILKLPIENYVKTFLES